MVIRLKSNLKIIAGNAKYLNLFKKIPGLLINKKDQTVIFKTRFGIHTFGIKRPIDVLILDSNLRIQKFKTVNPNQIFLWNPKYFLVLELPVGTIKEFNLRKGDVLSLNW